MSLPPNSISFVAWQCSKKSIGKEAAFDCIDDVIAREVLVFLGGEGVGTKLKRKQ